MIYKILCTGAIFDIPSHRTSYFHEWSSKADFTNGGDIRVVDGDVKQLVADVGATLLTAKKADS